jgi:hypothetical protein
LGLKGQGKNSGWEGKGEAGALGFKLAERRGRGRGMEREEGGWGGRRVGRGEEDGGSDELTGPAAVTCWLLPHEREKPEERRRRSLAKHPSNKRSLAKRYA